MKTLMTNPFRFGDPVEGDYYLSRPELTQTITQFLGNRIHVVLVGPRRYGKTSFVLNLLQELEEQSFVCLLVDIFNITSHRDFLHQLLRAQHIKKKGLSGTFKNWLKFVSKLRPKMSANIDSETGRPSFTVTLDKIPDKDVKELIQELLSGLSSQGERVVLAIDEFQKVSEIQDQGWLEATLRTHMQALKNTSCLLTGSRKSLIYEMLNDRSRPLYRAGQTVEFPSFGEEFTGWIVQRFAKIGIKCEPEAVQHLRHLVQDTPNYVQMICFHLVAEGKSHISKKEVETTLETVVRQNAYVYQTLLNTLSVTQHRALRLAASEGKGIFQKDLLAKYELASAPALSTAIKALKDKSILDEEGTSRGRVVFDDPLFATWLRLSTK